MKKAMDSAMWKIGSLACMIALLMAFISVNNTCCFSAYQPDVPEGL